MTKAPGRSVRTADNGLFEIVSEARSAGRRLDGLMTWTIQEVDARRLAPQFAAIVSTLGRLEPEQESFQTLIAFLSGASTRAQDINEILRNNSPHRDRTAAKASVRPGQTVRFLARLFLELGFAGWIVLFDELELIRLQGPVSRGKAYAELAFWVGLDSDRPLEGVGTVGAVTHDFVRANLQGEGDDRGRIPERLQWSAANQDKAPLSAGGMDFLISQQQHSCRRLTVQRAQQVQSSIREHYAKAMGYEPAIIPVTPADVRDKSIRQMIREWITRWDLKRAGRHDALHEVDVAKVVDESEGEDR